MGPTNERAEETRKMSLEVHRKAVQRLEELAE
jgi:hypothetical protein